MNERVLGVYVFICVLYQTRKNVFDHIPNSEKRVKSTTRSGVFVASFEVLENEVKQCLECLIHQSKLELRIKRRIKRKNLCLKWLSFQSQSRLWFPWTRERRLTNLFFLFFSSFFCPFVLYCFTSSVNKSHFLCLNWWIINEFEKLWRPRAMKLLWTNLESITCQATLGLQDGAVALG